MLIAPHSNTSGLAGSLIIPIAAKSIDAITTYIGNITEITPDERAFVVEFEPLEPHDSLPVWAHERAHLLTAHRQVWVHVNYRKYRHYYVNAMRGLNLSNFVIDHIMNRKLARKLEYEYIRLLHISRGTNVSAGRGEETESNKYQETEYAPPVNQLEVVSYADPSDITKMLDIKPGGFPLNGVRDAMQMLY